MNTKFYKFAEYLHFAFAIYFFVKYTLRSEEIILYLFSSGSAFTIFIGLIDRIILPATFLLIGISIHKLRNFEWQKFTNIGIILSVISGFIIFLFSLSYHIMEYLVYGLALVPLGYLPSLASLTLLISIFLLMLELRKIRSSIFPWLTIVFTMHILFYSLSFYSFLSDYFLHFFT